MNTRHILRMLVLFVLVAVSVTAIGTNDVNLESPATGTWYSDGDYTPGFYFNWSDPGDTTYDTAVCTLYMNTSSTDLVRAANGRNTTYGIGNYTSTMLHQNSTLTENTAWYWTISCYNESATPTSWYPAARAIYFDNTTPTVTMNTYSFTNNTWTNEDPWINVTVADRNYSYSTGWTCALMNYTNDYSFATGTIATNNTNVVISYAFSDGTYEIDGFCKDEALNNGSTSAGYTLKLDQTSPTNTWTSPTPTDGQLVTVSTVTLKGNITEQNKETVTFTLGSTTKNPVGWQAWDDSESAGAGGANAYDESWTSYVNSTDDVVYLYENYTEMTGTNLEDATKFDFEFQYNVVNASGNINVDFYNWTAGAWETVFTNASTANTVTNKTVHYNASTGATSYLNHSAGALRVRINLSNVVAATDVNGTARYYEGRMRFYYDRCSGTAPNHQCYWNFTDLTASSGSDFTIYVNDSATNSLTSTARTVKIDLETPTLDTTHNFTISSGTATWKVELTESNENTCTANIYTRADTNIYNSTGTFTTNVGSSEVNCTGTFTGANIATEGAFNVKHVMTDEASNSASANQTGIMTKLYDGWNLVTWSAVAENFSNACGTVSGCSQISWFNNTDATFTTYSTSTPSVNGGANLNPGNAFYIYVSADTYLITNDDRPTAGTAAENISLNETYWNTFGLLYDATIGELLNATDDWGDADMNITRISWLNVSEGSYYTCSRARWKCAGTSHTPDEITLLEGWAVFALTDANEIINRTVFK